MTVDSASRAWYSRGELGLGFLQMHFFWVLRGVGISGAVHGSHGLSGGCFELLVFLEQLLHLVLKGSRNVLGHLMAKHLVHQTVQALAFLIRVVLQGRRMDMTNDTGDVHIRALEDLARQGRPNKDRLPGDCGTLQIEPNGDLQPAGVSKQWQ